MNFYDDVITPLSITLREKGRVVNVKIDTAG
jgi:hypothetical protein